MKINNGVYSEKNNIMVFDSEELFAETVDYLFKSNDDFNDRLDSIIPIGLDEDEEEDYMLSNNLDENQVYIDFENQYNFSSLRKDINKREEAWLSRQGANKFDASTDPDNHPIILEAERTLLNPQGEVIILDKQKEPVIYKVFPWGKIKVVNLDTVVIKKINVEHIIDLSGITVIASNNPNVIINVEENQPNDCKTYTSKVEYYYHPQTGQQMKAFTRLNKSLIPSNKTVVAKTKGYKYKRNKWRNRRINIQAGLSGHNLELFYLCNDANGATPTAKSKKRRKLEYRLGRNWNIQPLYEVHDNGVYSYHRQGHFGLIVDFYNHNKQNYTY